MKKDWTDLLRQKLESYAPDVPQTSFEELKKKMLAAGGAASSTSPKGATVPMRRSLRWLAYAASLAAVVAGGALLLRNNGKDSEVAANIESVAEAGDAIATQESSPVIEIAANDVASEPVEASPLLADASPSSKGGSNRVKSAASQPVTIQEKDDEPLLADASQSVIPETTDSETESSDQPSQHSVKNEDAATSLPDIYSKETDPFAEPVAPVRKQLRKFSLGASGLLASNALGSNGDKAPYRGMEYTYDSDGNMYVSFGAPELQYHYTAPVSGGISLRYHFTNQFYAETGLRFTYLRTQVSPTGAQQNLLYAGIPAGLGFKFVQLGNFDIYGLAYAMASKCISGSESTNYPSNYTKLDEIPLMWSAGIAPGLEYHITPLIGLYAEPTVSYYFKDDKAPQTLYKDNPIYFTVNVGVRFNLE